jgi:hypothetical protein
VLGHPGGFPRSEEICRQRLEIGRAFVDPILSRLNGRRELLMWRVDGLGFASWLWRASSSPATASSCTSAPFGLEPFDLEHRHPVAQSVAQAAQSAWLSGSGAVSKTVIRREADRGFKSLPSA